MYSLFSPYLLQHSVRVALLNKFKSALHFLHDGVNKRKLGLYTQVDAVTFEFIGLEFSCIWVLVTIASKVTKILRVLWSAAVILYFVALLNSLVVRIQS